MAATPINAAKLKVGLDIYFHKTTPSVGINTTNVHDVYEDMEARYTEEYNKNVDKLLNNVLIATGIQERSDAIDALRQFTMEMHGADYNWYYNGIVNSATNEEIAKIVESNKKSSYPHEDVYFRKANFVYAFFSPYLEDEECMVTKDMVNELLEKCNKVLDAAHKDGWVDTKGNLVKGIQSASDNTERDEYISKLNTDWMKVADEILPTQSGFFFGSTEYDYWYLYSVKNCVNQFSKLLNKWKSDEIVFCIMSW